MIDSACASAEAFARAASVRAFCASIFAASISSCSAFCARSACSARPVSSASLRSATSFWRPSSAVSVTATADDWVFSRSATLRRNLSSSRRASSPPVEAASRALGGELRVRRLLELDLGLREPALELLASALGALVLLFEPLAIRLGSLELDADLADVVRHLRQVIALAAAPTIALGFDEGAAEPLVLFLERGARCQLARRCRRRFVALGLELADLLERPLF